MFVLDEEYLFLSKAKRGRNPKMHHVGFTREGLKKAASINIHKPPAVFIVFGSKASVAGGIIYANYISDDMTVTVYNELGFPISSQEELHNNVKSWEHGFVERKNASNIQHYVMSYPVDANPKAVLKAAFDTMKKSFPDRECIFSLHTDKDHPHVHFIMPRHSTLPTGKRLEIGPKNLQEIRHQMVRSGKKFGIEMDASTRKDRGLEKSKKNRGVEQMKSQRNVVSEYEKKMTAEVAESFDAFTARTRATDDRDVKLLGANKEERIKQVKFAVDEARNERDKLQQQELIDQAAKILLLAFELRLEKTRKRKALEKRNKELRKQTPDRDKKLNEKLLPKFQESLENISAAKDELGLPPIKSIERVSHAIESFNNELIAEKQMREVKSLDYTEVAQNNIRSALENAATEHQKSSWSNELEIFMEDITGRVARYMEKELPKAKTDAQLYDLAKLSGSILIASYKHVIENVSHEGDLVKPLQGSRKQIEAISSYTDRIVEATQNEEVLKIAKSLKTVVHHITEKRREIENQYDRGMELGR